MRFALLLFSVLFTVAAKAGNYEPGDYLVKIKPSALSGMLKTLATGGSNVQPLTDDGWVRVKVAKSQLQSFNPDRLYFHPSVLHVQPNYKISINNTFNLKSALETLADEGDFDWGDILKPVPPDNPEIPAPATSGNGADPHFSKQWGMQDAGVTSAWNKTKGRPEIVVAVIDTGVDYTHEDLIENMWRNPGETGVDSQGRDKSKNGVDDDQNGFVDDIVGWDFASKDNKPYDFTTSILDMLAGGGNPGHGTHCAGNVAARGGNGKGISGVAPYVKIMALRFITEKGQGTTADAIGAIQYAVKNGAKITSNSWGSEGEDPQDPDNKALIDAIKAAENAGVLFIAAAGNGHQGVGYDNDTDNAPGYPASYDMDIIVSVAALDVNGQLGSFSNWGARTVDIGAPGVKVFSTVPANGYQDTVIPGLATWDGTSMATPHVAGAAALYWSLNPNKTWREVKQAIITSAKPTSSMSGKSVSGGRLDVDALLNRF